MARGRKKALSRAKPAPQLIEALLNEMAAAGEHPSTGSEDNAREWLQKHSEKELWFFARWILGNDHLALGTFHRQIVCPYLTDFTTGRFKLLMLPMGHLKTTVASRSMPLHAMIQPKASNIYVPGVLGSNMRVLLANESEAKSKENLSVSQRHAQENDWLPWLWPETFWDDPAKESPRWTDTQLEFKRHGAVWAEASIKAIGIKSAYIGGYYDIEVLDDIAALEASQNPPLMERAGKFRRASMTRFHDKRRGIHIGVGTHWGSNDVYVDWKKDGRVTHMIKAVVEWDERLKIEVPLWPEKFPLDIIDTMRKSMDPIEWALWYMNKPVPSGYTALNWSDLREYHFSADGKELYFEDSKMDERIAQRYQTISKNLGFVLGSARYDPMNAKPRSGAHVKGMDDGYLDHMRLKYGHCGVCGAKDCVEHRAAPEPTGYKFLGQVQ